MTARITPFSVKITPFSAGSPRSEDQESHDSPIWVKCRPLWVKSRPIVDPEYPPTGSAGMDTKMRQTIPGHLAGEYRRTGAGVADLRRSRNRRDEVKVMKVQMPTVECL